MVNDFSALLKDFLHFSIPWIFRRKSLKNIPKFQNSHIDAFPEFLHSDYAKFLMFKN